MARMAQKVRSSLISALLAGGLLYAAPVLADSASATSAKQVVKAMSDYLASQKNLSGDFDAELDVITPDIEKVQFSASGSVLLSRPDKVRLIRKGGYSEVELLSDGKTVTIINLGDGSYSQVKSPGTVDGMIDLLRSNYGIDMPAADLLLTNSYDELMDGVIEAKHIGVGVVDGVECEHLAFRNADTDWQLWVRSGDRPLPCKYVISSKTVAAAPDYRIRFRNWSTGKAPAAGAFSFAPVKGAKPVAFEQLSGIGELPPPAPPSTGGR
jgi:hypothetical protein